MIMNKDDETESNDGQGHDDTSSDFDSCDMDAERWNPRKFLMQMREKAAAASFVEHDESMTLDLLITMSRSSPHQPRNLGAMQAI